MAWTSELGRAYFPGPRVPPPPAKYAPHAEPLDLARGDLHHRRPPAPKYEAKSYQISGEAHQLGHMATAYSSPVSSPDPFIADPVARHSAQLRRIKADEMRARWASERRPNPVPMTQVDRLTTTEPHLVCPEQRDKALDLTRQVNERLR